MIRNTSFLFALALAVLLMTTGCSADGAPPRGARPATKLASYAVGLRPRAIAVADLNADGSVDIAVANSGDGTVTVLLGQRGVFRLSRTYQAGKEPCDVKAGDVDRDGDADLVIANHETSEFTVLMNDGRGGFSPARTITLPTGARPHIHSVAVADFDGDGWLDVAVESADTREVRLRRGGRGGFGPIIPIAVGTMPYSQIGAADVTGDGISDILVPGHGDRTIRVITKSGSTFTLAPATMTTREKPWVVAAGDVDGDTRRDLVVVETDAVTVWLNGGDHYRAAAWSPVRVPGATAVATGDLDGDRLHDIVIGAWDSDEIIVVASRAPAPRKIRACGRPIGLAIADLDDDGLGEIVVACATEARVVVLRSPLHVTPATGRGGG